MKRVVLISACAAMLLIASPRAEAEWWVGGIPYSLQANKYNSYYGEARPIRWSCQGPMTLWGPLTPRVSMPAEAFQSRAATGETCRRCGKAGCDGRIAQPKVTPRLRQLFFPPKVSP